MNQELWKQAVSFHGHECPGLAIGFRACEIATERLGLTFSPDEEVVCVTENDACGADAVQAVTGCTFGKGNLIYRGTGKMAFTFFKRSTGKKLRVIFKPSRREMDRKTLQSYILEGPVDELFLLKEPAFELPEKARIFTTVICEVCGEGAPESKIRIQNGQKVCLDCFQDYSRGW